MNTINTEKKGTLLCITAAFCYAFGPILSKLLYGGGLPWQLVVGCRGMIPAVIITAYAMLCRPAVFHINKRDLPRFLLNSAAFAGISLFHYFSLFYITASVTAVILCSIPIFTMVFSRVILKEAFTANKLLALIPVTGGTLLIINLGNIDAVAAQPGTTILGINSAVFGIGGALLCCVMSALYNTFTRRLNLSYSGQTVNTWCYMLSFPVFFILGINPILRFDWEPVSLLVMLLMALVGLAAYSFFSLSLHYINAGKGGMLATINPVLSVIMSVTLLGERLTASQLIGCFAVGLGLIIMEKGPKRLNKRKSL